MSDILLSPEVAVTLFIDIFLFLLLTLAFYQSIVLLKGYNVNAASAYQYKLEKKSYLLITIISIAIIIKFLLLPFFVHTLDILSYIVPGAMCGAGVIQANEYGEITLFVKIVIVLLSMLWFRLNAKDEKTKQQPYFKIKLYFFIFVYLLLVVELFLELNFFINISTESPVLCCGSIYAGDDDKNLLPFNLSILNVLYIFYALYALLLVLNYYKKRFLLALTALLYVYISYYVIVHFFGPYIYELPTHKCPFCMLQSDYYFIGYAIFLSLLVSTFYALSAALFSFRLADHLTSSYLYTLFVLLTSYSFVIYLMKNGTYLFPL
ncbi:MAG: hypothetical protein U9Q40_07395 [Campylobacterota bacterium]|nr:hypothetical protein [Campylobacterota bacterium]